MTDVSLPLPASPSWRRGARAFGALVARELQEHRGTLVLLPAAVAGVVALLLVVAAAWAGVQDVDLPAVAKARAEVAAHQGDLAQAGWVLGMGLLAPTLLAWAMAALFYGTGALFEERRDRSVLFFKSLPVSDLATVSSKALVVILVGPALALAFGAGLVLLGAGLAWAGGAALGLAHGGADVALGMLQALAWAAAGLPVAAAWALPTAGWWLLVSAVARTKPLLWAVLGPVAAWLGVMAVLGVEAGHWVGEHVLGRALVAWPAMDAWTQDPQAWLWVLGQPTLWVGAIAGVGMLVLAARVRRWKDEG